MAQQNSVKYCRTTTCTHPLSREHMEFLEEINILFQHEGAKNCNRFSTNNIALNLDKIEKKISQNERRDRRPTCDLMFGISEHERNKQIVLMECKFNQNGNFDNKFKESIRNKIEYSKYLLAHSAFFKTTFVLVKEKTFNEAKNRINRLRQGSANLQIEPSHINDLYQRFF